MQAFAKTGALVTGATGYVGGRLAQRLVDDGWLVRVLVRDPDRLPAALRRSAQVCVADLCDAAAVAKAVDGMRVVFHCAANVKTWDSWPEYRHANVHAVQTLLNALAVFGPNAPRLLHMSTVDVYGYPTSPCTEDAPADGGGFGYGESKLLGERLVRGVCEATGIPYTIVRPTNIIGPRSQFIARIGAELKSGVMLLVSGGRANAGFIYIDNLVDDLIWAATAQQAIGQCYNLRDSYDVSWAEFIQRFRRAIGGKGVVINLPFAVADAVAHILAGTHRTFMPAHEPLLHPLLVRMFGRTCGHSAEKIRRDRTSECGSRVPFDQALDCSVRWFLEQR
jgi:nucleoside-diphosphate-sugar epimerase